MLNEISPSAKLFIFAIVLLLLSPIIVFMLPFTISQTFYYSRDNIVLITPTYNFILLFLAIALIILTLIILGFKRNKYTYLITLLVIVSSLVLGYFSVLSYTAIQNKQIVFKDFHHQTTYEWQDIKEVIYEYEIGTVGTYYFQTKNNEKFVIEEDGQFGAEEKSAIYNLANDNGATFLEREKVK
ncbi:hypothetical protein AMS59_13150 [Lysinibacillus sp. FJAT-14745]|uniref:hypothetical protein n=1 Tax=Lysinibacillus sp. FJAT-14745 TaxID=1704289 RepID=UPI0006ABC207|nr:hypothetical protein [Lysinibacillus sp. FJAT-14745]KOP78053.1 hypothetical protein AMS59_13150 [Lysinibacillus sp. FJAT-14745]